MSSTATIVITYDGTDNTDAEALSYTLGGTAWGSITAANLKLARKLMSSAIKRTDGKYGYKVSGST